MIAQKLKEQGVLALNFKAPLDQARRLEGLLYLTLDQGLKLVREYERIKEVKHRVQM